MHKFPYKKHLQLKVDLSQFLVATMDKSSTKEDED